MVRVYRVKHNFNDFQALRLDEDTPEMRKRMILRGVPRGDGWEPPKVYSPTPTLAAPDIWRLEPLAGMVFPPAAYDRLWPLLHESGEMLPLPYGDETWQMLNLHAVECIDVDASTWLMSSSQPERRIKIRKMAFLERRLPGTPLFQVPEAIGTSLCLEGIRDPDEEFKAVVESAGFRGITFELLWDSEAQAPAGA